ncbi:MAG TPA: sugar transferase [Candidatus Nanopelagicales bacterium]
MVLRAFVLDASILTVAISSYVWIMVQQNLLYDRLETVLYGVALGAGWLVLILLRRGYDERFLGVGWQEFKCIITASATLLAMISVASYVAKRQPPLRLVLPSLLTGMVLLLLGRWLLRTWLGHQRVRGRFQQGTLVIGDGQRAAALVDAFAADPVAGFQVIGTVAPPADPDSSGLLDRWLDEVTEWIHLHRVQAVAVAESSAVEPELLRRLAWRLEGPGIDLLVSPVLSDVAGPRVSARPAAGLPLLHLDEPTLTGPARALKRAVDLAITIPAVIVALPLFALIAIAVKLDSPGHVFYFSERIGRSGEAFRCMKFRTMISGADQLRADVIGDPDDEIAERYRQDPRITRVGVVLRRWSLDELPQLFNVLAGSMSLVGPRPLLPDEMPLLGEADHRRHLTKPGLTGLWQISGRKEVCWDDRMRMDLHYIESWSIALDLVVIVKTAKAVVTGRGAY